MAFPYVSFIITLIYGTVDRRLWIFHQCNIHLLKEQFLLYITYYTYFLKVIVTSARWLNKTFHVSFPRNNNDSTITHKQKYLCWSCGIQYQMPRNQGGQSCSGLTENVLRGQGPLGVGGWTEPVVWNSMLSLQCSLHLNPSWGREGISFTQAIKGSWSL